MKPSAETLSTLQSPAQISTMRTGVTEIRTDNNTSSWLCPSGSEVGLRRGLKVAFLNTTSLKKHRSQLRQVLSANSYYHVFGVAETRLGPEIDDCHIDVPGYNVLRQDRNLAGGGILLYVKNNLKAKVLHTSKTTQQGKPLLPEYIFCAVWEEHSPPTLIVLGYRPPDVPIRSD